MIFSDRKDAAHRLVKVFAAATGAVVADHDIIEMPGTCPQVALKSETEIKTSVAWELAQQHLESIVQTGTFVDPDRVTPQE